MDISGSGIKLRHLQILREILRTGSERKAALQLHVTQPAISQNVKQLEEAVGFALFVRANNRLMPTDQAWDLLRSIETAFTGLDRLEKMIEGIRTSEVRSLVIAVPTVFTLRSIPRAVKSIRDSDPKQTVFIRTGSYADVLDDVHQGRADVAISRLPLDERLFDWRPIGHAINVCLFEKNHKFSRLDVVKPEDLVGEPLIDIDPQFSSHQMNVNALRFLGSEPVVAVEYDVHGHEVGFVIEGVGVAITNEFIAREYRQFPIEYRPFEPGATYHYVVTWQKGRQLSDSLRYAVEKICSAFAM